MATTATVVTARPPHVRVIRSCKIDGTEYRPGDVVDVSGVAVPTVLAMERTGLAVRVDVDGPSDGEPVAGAAGTLPPAAPAATGGESETRARSDPEGAVATPSGSPDGIDDVASGAAASIEVGEPVKPKTIEPRPRKLSGARKRR